MPSSLGAPRRTCRTYYCLAPVATAKHIRAGRRRRRSQWYDSLGVISWVNLGFDAADFGGGGAARVMWHEDRTLLPGCMVCPPCRGDAFNVSSLCVKPEHADAFLQELDLLGIL